MDLRRVGLLIMVCGLVGGLSMVLVLVDALINGTSTWQWLVPAASLVVWASLVISGYRRWKQPVNE